MDKNAVNAVKRARISAGTTQEKAAEMSGYSVDAIQAWENGSRRAPVKALDKLAICYDAPWLAALYLRETSEGSVAEVVPDFTPGEPLPRAVLELLDAVNAFFDRHGDRRLVSIAADGAISEAERPEFEAILADIAAISRAYMAVRYARDEEQA